MSVQGFGKGTGFDSLATSGGGGGADLSDLEFTSVDLTDGTWTLVDPSSAISSTTIAGGIHTITLNTVVASSDLSIQGATHTWPRWYKTLEVGATRINGADLFLCQTAVTALSLVNAGTDFPVLLAGPAVDPTNNTALSMLAWGGQVRTNGVAGGVWTVNAGAVGVGGGQTGFYSSSLSGAGDASLVSAINVNVTNDYVSRAQRGNNSATVGANDLFLQVGLGSQTNTNGFTAGTTVSFSLGIITIKLRYV
jgi:hypothetical protein